MPLPSGPCEPWPFDPCCPVDGYEPEVIERWRMVATQILFNLSGRRHGPSCPITIRPCGKSCIEQFIPLGYWGPQSGGRIPYVGEDGAWRNAVIGCDCRTDCSCTTLCELRLDGPIHDVVEVRVDGVVLPPESYRVDSPNILVRTDGGCWEPCQALDAPPTEPGTASVTYRIGLPLDAAAIAAVSELACHLLKGCRPGSGCGCNASNRNLTRVTRQGVEMEMADPSLIYSEGRTGLPLADAWLAAVNPYGLRSPSRVYSPDFKRPRRQVWP